MLNPTSSLRYWSPGIAMLLALGSLFFAGWIYLHNQNVIAFQLPVFGDFAAPSYVLMWFVCMLLIIELILIGRSLNVARTASRERHRTHQQDKLEQLSIDSENQWLGGEYGRFAKVLDRIHASDPNSIRYLQRAHASLPHDDDRQEAVIRALIEQQPERWWWQLELIEYELVRGRTDEAEKLITEILRKTRGYPAVRDRCLQAIVAHKHWQLAVILQERIVVAAKNKRARRLKKQRLAIFKEKLAQSLVQEQAASALLILKSALKDDPSCLPAILAISSLYRSLGDVNQSVEALIKSYGQSTSEGIFAFALQQLPDIRWRNVLAKCLPRLIPSHSSDPLPYLLLGLCHFLDDRMAACLEQLEAIIGEPVLPPLAMLLYSFCLLHNSGNIAGAAVLRPAIGGFLDPSHNRAEHQCSQDPIFGEPPRSLRI